MAFAEGIDTNTEGDPVQADDFTTDERLGQEIPQEVINLNSALQPNGGQAITNAYISLRDSVEAYPGRVRIEIQNTHPPSDEIDEIRIDFGGNKRVRYRSAADIDRFLGDLSYNFVLPRGEELSTETPILTALQTFLQTFVINTGGADDGKMSGEARFDIKLEKDTNEPD